MRKETQADQSKMYIFENYFTFLRCIWATTRAMCFAMSPQCPKINPNTESNVEGKFPDEIRAILVDPVINSGLAMEKAFLELYWYHLTHCDTSTNTNTCKWYWYQYFIRYLLYEYKDSVVQNATSELPTLSNTTFNFITTQTVWVVAAVVVGQPHITLNPRMVAVIGNEKINRNSHFFPDMDTKTNQVQDSLDWRCFGQYLTCLLVPIPSTTDHRVQPNVNRSTVSSGENLLCYECEEVQLIVFYLTTTFFPLFLAWVWFCG